MVIGLGTPLFGNSIHNTHENFNLIDSEFLHAFLKNIPFIFTILGAVLSLFLINCFGVSKEVVYNYKMSKAYRTLYTFLSQKWHFDQITNELIAVKTMNFGYRGSFQLMDKGNIELFGPAGLGLNISSFSKVLSHFQTGFVYHYSFVMMGSLISLICFFILIHFDLADVCNSMFFLLLFSYSLISLNNNK